MKIFFLDQYIDSSYIIKNIAFKNIGSAKTKNNDDLLCYAMNLEYLKIADENKNISGIITLPSLQDKSRKVVATSDEPDILYGMISNQLIDQGYIKPTMEFKKSDCAIIDPSAYVSEKTYIGGNVHIGKNVIINDYTIVEDDCIIGDNVVLGCEGFYFKRNHKGELVKFLHAGGVHLCKNVEIMTGSIVQRAHDADFTKIGEGTKVSVHCNISHSANIGKHNMITGNVQIAGRVKMGDYCWIGNSSTLSDSVVIGDNVTIRIGSVVISDIKEKEEVSGNFAYNHRKRVRNFLKEQR